MHREVLHIFARSLKRNILLLVLLAIVVGAYISTHRDPTPPSPPTSDIVNVAKTPYTLEYSEPIRLRIPTIGINAAFEAPLGVNAQKEIEVPKAFDTVGWYKYGPTPGEIGPAVVLGHVDSYKGPEVFYHLRDLKAGDKVEIERENGTVATFEVVRLETVSQDNFPTDEVYGSIPYAGLRLITCSGVYDHGTQRYSHNLIVFARLLEDS